MIDFLRVISPYIYTLVSVLIILFVAYKVTMKNVESDYAKTGTKKIFKGVFYGVLLLFSLAVLRMAFINEVPRNDVDHSIKKERSNYSVEQAKLFSIDTI